MASSAETNVAQMVELAQFGDRSAIGELIRRFTPLVFRVAMSRGLIWQDAEELTQDVFTHAMRKLPQLRDARCFAGWLRLIADRMAINRLARCRRLLSVEPKKLEGIIARSGSPSQRMETGETIVQMRAALGELKPLDRQTLEAFYLRGRSLKQMGREFEVPIGTIKRRMHVARRRLRKIVTILDPTLAA